MPKSNQDKRTTLQQIFDERSINQAGFARRMGIQPATLNRIVKGMQRPSLDNALRIARALDLRVEDIWGLKEDEK